MRSSSFFFPAAVALPGIASFLICHTQPDTTARHGHSRFHRQRHRRQDNVNNIGGMAKREILSVYHGGAHGRRGWVSIARKLFMGPPGESGDAEPYVPPLPDPGLSPVSVIESQLHSLRTRDLRSVFVHASPSNRRATGPLSRFVTLFNNPAYAPLLGCDSWEMVSALPLGSDRYRVAVLIRPAVSVNATLRIRYSWILERQGGGGELSSESESVVDYEGCWMVDGVVLEGIVNSSL